MHVGSVIHMHCANMVDVFVKKDIWEVDKFVLKVSDVFEKKDIWEVDKFALKVSDVFDEFLFL